MDQRTRRQIFIGLLIVLLGGAPLPCRADTPQSKPVETDDTADLQALIQQLDDPDPQARNAAQRELATFGAEALPMLRDAANGNSPEIRTRARVAIQRILSNDRETRVSLHVHDVTARQALDLLAKQANLRIEADPMSSARLNRTRVTLDLKRKPFFAALLPICEAADLRPVDFPRNQHVMRLGNFGGAWSSRYTVVDGPYAITLLNLTKRFHLRFGTDPDPSPRPVVLQMVLYAEPQVPVQTVTQIQITRCEDETGFPIAPDEPRSFAATQFPNSQFINLHPEGAKKIGLMEGKVTFRLEQSPQKIELADVQKAKGEIEVVGSVRMSIKDLRVTAPGQWRLRVQLLTDGRTAEEIGPIASAIADSRPRLLDNFGRELDEEGEPKRTDSADAVELVFQFSNFADHGKGRASDPVKLTWDVPTRTREVTVPFRFKDVPLP